MAPTTQQSIDTQTWQLVHRQHGVISRQQLVDLGFSVDAIRHRITNGRLRPVGRGIYVVSRPELTERGRWMAAVLSCGPDAALSHSSAAALWQIRPQRKGPVEVSVPISVSIERPGILVHRRSGLSTSEFTRCQGIPTTTPACTLIDIASKLDRNQLEAAVNEADVLDLIDPEALRVAVGDVSHRRGVKVLRDTLERRTFTYTKTQLERRFLPIARRAGLPLPQTNVFVNGFEVDFYWPSLGLIVESDGLRYHRTAAKQTKDNLRDQAHVRAGMTPLRFSRAQVRFDPDEVETTLIEVSQRLSAN